MHIIFQYKVMEQDNMNSTLTPQAWCLGGSHQETRQGRSVDEFAGSVGKKSASPGTRRILALYHFTELEHFSFFHLIYFSLHLKGTHFISST